MTLYTVGQTNLVTYFSDDLLFESNERSIRTHIVRLGIGNCYYHILLQDARNSLLAEITNLCLHPANSVLKNNKSFFFNFFNHCLKLS